MRRSNCILFIKMMILSTLAFSCRGLNDRKVDPVVIAHAKAVIDSNFLPSPYLQVGCILLRLNILFGFGRRKEVPIMLMNSQPTFLNIKGNLYSFILRIKSG